MEEKKNHYYTHSENVWGKTQMKLKTKRNILVK